MKKIILCALILGSTQAALAMPCDTGYSCQSKSGKFKIDLQRCRYINNLHLLDVKINNVPVAGVSLGPAWDGKSIGNTLLAFQINLPAPAGASKILSVEIPAHTMKGVIKEQYAASEPEPYTTLFAEPIRCQISM